MKKLRVAIVGFGFMGKTHAKNIIDGDMMQLCAIVDSRIESISQVSGNIDTGEISSEILDKVHKYKTLEECLANESLDAVYVCVHTLAHYEVAKKSLQHGLNVFVEKPFVLNVSEGEDLISEAKNVGKKLFVGHVVRFMPAYRKLKEIYSDGRYGKLKLITMSRFSGVPNWGDWSNRRTNFGSSGGALFDLVIHDIDFLQSMLGIPDSLDAKCFPGVLSNQDYVSAFWKYKNIDAVVKVEGGLTFHSKFPFEAGFKVLFEKASISWSSSEGDVIKVADDNELSTIKIEDANSGYKLEDEMFAKSISGDNTMSCSAESALSTIKLCYKHLEK